MAGLVFNNKSEKVPDILNLTEIKTFLGDGTFRRDEKWGTVWS
jgi:hypothetical protein